MFRRPAPLITAGLFAAALSVGATGWATGTQALTDAGILGAVATVPLLYWVMITRTHQITDDQLADAHQAGYALALHHVARGLLVPDPAPPTPGHHQDDEQAPGNVVQLRHRPTYTTEEKRTAQ